ncbi:MAG TPA: hypothetical protein VJB70_01360 [Candidatus Paceibacterota bacterium]
MYEGEKINTGDEQFKPFDWRLHTQNPEELSETAQNLLDTLTELANNKDEASTEFHLYSAHNKSPIHAMVQFYRNTLTDEERGMLFDELKKIKGTLPPGDFRLEK